MFLIMIFHTLIFFKDLKTINNEHKSNMDIDEYKSNVDINKEQWMDINADDSGQKNNWIDDPMNNDLQDENTNSHSIQSVKKVSKFTRNELHKTKWYRFNHTYLQKCK